MRHNAPKKAIVIGHRDDGQKYNIGGALVRRAPSHKFDVIGIATSKTLLIGDRSVPLRDHGDWREVISILDDRRVRPDIVFVALNPMKRGEVALRYKLHYLTQGIPVVSAEKRAMAFHTPRLMPHLPLLGFDAMVGGNARLLSECRSRRVRHSRVRILCVANGTANFDLSEVQDLHGLANAAKVASILRYAEPDDGQGDGPVKQLKGEIEGDIPSKTSVFHNLVCVGSKGPFLNPDMIRVKKLTPQDIRDYCDWKYRNRYFVEFCNDQNLRPRFSGKDPGSFCVKIGEWTISGGFENVPRGTPLGDWAPDGVENGMIIEYLEGHNDPVRIAAAGAGPGPTTDTMFQNAAELLHLPY